MDIQTTRAHDRWKTQGSTSFQREVQWNGSTWIGRTIHAPSIFTRSLFLLSLDWEGGGDPLPFEKETIRSKTTPNHATSFRSCTPRVLEDKCSFGWHVIYDVAMQERDPVHTYQETQWAFDERGTHPRIEPIESLARERVRPRQPSGRADGIVSHAIDCHLYQQRRLDRPCT